MAFESVYVRYGNGEQYGPATLADVAQWAASGQIPRQCWLVDAQTGESRPLTSFPEVSSKLPTVPGELFIPRNTNALISYYIGIFSWVGCFFAGIPGILMGAAAVFYGIKGLKDAGRNPLLKGKVHCWVGIIAGVLCALAGMGYVVVIILAMTAP